MRRIDLLTQACDPKTLTVGQLMQDAPFSCTSRTDALTISRLMTTQNFGGLPVVGEDGTLVGLVTEYDLLQAMIEGRDLRKVLAAEIMTSSPLAAAGKHDARRGSKLVSGSICDPPARGARQEACRCRGQKGSAARLYEGIGVLVIINAGCDGWGLVSA